MRRDPVRLLDILNAAKHIVAFTKDVEFEDFLTDRKLQLALQRLLEIIGEAARGITDETKNRHPGVPWERMIGMRHIITHQYFRVNLALVWEAAVHDVPALVSLIEPLVPPEDSV